MGNQIALVGVIPEPTDILDHLAVMVHQGIIDGDDPARRIARRGMGPCSHASRCSLRCSASPRHLGNPPVQAGLVRGVSKLGIDGRDILPICHHQTGQILGQVPTLRGVGEQPAKFLDSFLNHGGKGDNTRHGRPSHILARGCERLGGGLPSAKIPKRRNSGHPSRTDHSEIAPFAKVQSYLEQVPCYRCYSDRARAAASVYISPTRSYLKPEPQWPTPNPCGSYIHSLPPRLLVPLLGHAQKSPGQVGSCDRSESFLQ